ncbi:hypothetical protein EST38_g10767 [Candolleomyces aberdarensis]|uniref:DNA breaking-rejoining enzyme n=1 Tax=Candolleomyces aberdarensis TaxID=2316362 RepID=A0A4V1Q2H3_9AGAR|nr:hypothetical protein EST38_g10767 [Candolleomyces aberdarensis]
MKEELSLDSIRKINSTLLASLAEATRTSYGAGLLRFSEYCDREEISELRRMPASSFLLSGFIAEFSSTVSGSTIHCWMSGIRAWHILNNAPWHGGDEFVSQVKKGAIKLSPPSSKRPLRNPVTLEHMIALQRSINLLSSLDVAVWALACVAFWGCCRLGELAVKSEVSFDPAYNVDRNARMTFTSSSSSRSSQESVSLHIPWTKTTREQGAEVNVTGHAKCSPVDALKAHLELSADAPKSSHLFSYRDQSGRWRPLTKARFLDRCHLVWNSLGLLKIHGHSFRIGGATELLLGGIPPHVVASIGRWKSMAFLLYWRKVSEVVSNTFSSSYDPDRFQSIEKAFEDFRSRLKIPASAVSSS